MTLTRRVPDQISCRHVFKNNITLLACVQPQLGCDCTQATLYDLNQREADNRKKNLTAYRTKMKLHCREGSVFFYFEESQILATEKKNKAISLGNSHQEVIGYVVSRLVTGL